MKTNQIRQISLSFTEWFLSNDNLISNVEKAFDIWWDLKGEKHFKTSIPLNLTILEEAQRIIFDREEEKDRQYGPFSDSISRASRVATELCNKTLTTEDVFKVLISLKISRMAYNHKHDTMLDAIGYIAGLDDYLKTKNKINDK